MKLHRCPLLLLIYFALNSSVRGIDFSFFEKWSLPYRFFLFVLLRNHQMLEQIETIIMWKNNLRAHRVNFAAFSRAIRNWWEKRCISHVVNYTIRCESDWRKVPICWGKMGANFPGSPNSMDFAAFSHAMGNWWENPCISHIIKYTIGCESNGKKGPILWEKYE